MLDELYQEVILQYAKSRACRGHISGAPTMALQNPLCGDEIILSVQFDGDVVESAKFDGSGCSISQAAAAILAELVVGKTLEEITQLKDDYTQLLRGKLDPESADHLQDLACLAGVAKYPARVRCAMLAFDAMSRLVKSQQSGQNTLLAANGGCCG